MALPVNKLPKYNLTIPSTGKKVNFRPFVVKEEKALLIAQQSEDESVMVETLKDIIESCVETIDVSKLATFDIEYIFTQIRSKSVGEDASLILRCQHCDDDNAKVKLNLDLSTIEVIKSDGHDKKISLFDDVGMVMKYPGFDLLKNYKIKSKDLNSIIELIISCIDFIYDGDNLYYASETPREELVQFIENLNTEQFEKIEKFFETMPVLSKTFDYKCPVCEAQNSITIKGIHNFF